MTSPPHPKPSPGMFPSFFCRARNSVHSQEKLGKCSTREPQFQLGRLTYLRSLEVTLFWRLCFTPPCPLPPEPPSRVPLGVSSQ